MLSYLVNFAWMGVTSGMAIPVIFFIMLNQICETEYTYQGVQAADGQALSCFNLTRIGTQCASNGPYTLHTELQRFL